ncbi:unnamed protein product [Aphanomyces euteiches]
MSQRRLVHAVAKSGFVNGNFYDKARPNFPIECLYAIPSSLTRTSPVVEIGSGTGKFTELLASRFDNLTTVEPSEGMRSAFAEKFPSIPCLEGTAEHLPLPDNSQDAIYLAQAFHWCSNIDALQEFSRVLVPRGHLGLVWNLEEAQTPWVKELRSIYERFDGHGPQYRTMEWEKVFRDLSIFEYPLKHIRIQRTIPVDSVDQIWDRVYSKSYVQTLPEKEMEGLKAELHSILVSAAFTRDGERRILYPYVTDVYLTRKVV